MPSGAIITTLGLAKLASATPLNQLNISALAVGDGNGGYPTLDPSMTALANEVWRGTPSPPIRDPNSPNVLIFEAVIPPSVGGFTVREQAIFDDAGDMIAIGQTSVVEKPLPNTATGVILTVRLHVQLDNAEQVDLFFQDDPTISAVNVSNANGGSVQDFIDDYDGFTAALLAQAGIVPSGNPDKLGASQRVDAIKAITAKSHINSYASVDQMVADSNLKVGMMANTISRYQLTMAEMPLGGAEYIIVEAGTGVEDGGVFINLANGLQARQIVKGALSVVTYAYNEFGAQSSAIQKACDYLAAQNGYEGSKSLYFDSSISYNINATVALNVSHGNMKWWSDGNVSLVISNLASEYAIVVDYFTGATANFLKFDMENMHLTDTSGGTLRKGLKLSRVIGSRFVNCHFNYLANPLDMGSDSNLNIFDSCQWRGNVRPIVNSQISGPANNNIFLNCQFRYNQDTIFDSLSSVDYAGTMDYAKFIGGDVEPYNLGIPIIRANRLTIIGTAFERNTSATPVIEVHDQCDLSGLTFPSDGATPAFALDVVGKRNKLNITSGGFAKAIHLKSTSRDNTYSITTAERLVSNAEPLVIDDGVNNVCIARGIPQTRLLNTKDAYEVTPVLTDWVAVGCTVAYSESEKGYIVTANGSSPRAYIYYTVSALDSRDYPFLGYSSKPLNVGGKSLSYIVPMLPASTPSGSVASNIGSWQRHYIAPQDDTLESGVSPTFVIELIRALNGDTCVIRDVAIEFSSSLPSL